MKKCRVNRLFFLLLLLWFLLNLIQAVFTGLHYDELYYAVWGRYLDWGYFDHPPAVAVLTYLGALFFEGNLSVRFFTLILNIGTLLLIWYSIDERYRQTRQSVWAFFIIISVLTMFSVYAFTTTPDVVLVFFASLFLFAYRRFIELKDWLSVFLLAIAMSGMLYGKYHGVLFVGLVVLSNLRLLLNVRFWSSGILALFLLIPHILWQYYTDFSSLKFHLVARSLGFDIKYVLEFIPGQLGGFNPFVLGGVLFILWKYRPENTYDRALYFLIVGIISFFALTTIKGRAEAHWTSVASIPMIIILVEGVMKWEKVKRCVFRFVAGSVLLIILARIVLLTDFSEKFGYADRESFYKDIEKIAGNFPVVFNSSFQDAAAYEFYTGKPLSTTVSAIENRQTQYDFWQKEQLWHNKRVFVVLDKGDDRIPKGVKTYHFPRYGLEGFFMENLQTSNRLRIKYNLDKRILTSGDILEIPIEIENPTKHDIDFQYNVFSLKLKVVFLILKRNYVIENAEFSEPLGVIKSGNKIKGKLKFRVPETLEQKDYKFAVIIESFFGHTLNSPFENVKIN